MPTDDELEDFRKNLLKKAQEEQEEIEAENQAQRLKEETYQTYEETKKRLDEMVEDYKKNFDEIADHYKKTLDEASEKVSAGKRSSWERVFSGMGGAAGAVLGDALNRSLQTSIDSTNLSNLSPGIGRAGKSIGAMLGAAIGTFFGGPVGTAVGAASGYALGGGIDEAGMQMEGYRMIGARVAPLAQSGLRYTAPLEALGRTYRVAVKDIVRDTGATADEVMATADAFAKLGAGFLDGGRDMTEFTLGMDRVLKLQPGTVLKMQTDLVRHYGESIGGIRSTLRDVVGMTREFSKEQQDNKNATAGAFSSAALVVDALGQITSQARNSGASMETLNTMARALVETMVSGEGKGKQRPDQIIKSAGSIVGFLMPKPAATTGSEAMASGVSKLLLEKTSLGRHELRSELNLGKEYGMTAANLETIGAFQASKSRNSGTRRALGKMMGVEELVREQGELKTRMLLESQGVTPQDWVAMISAVKDMEKAGVFSAKDPLQAFRDFTNDPKHKATSEDLKGLRETQKDLANKQQSMMTKAANSLVDISANINQTWKDAPGWIARAVNVKGTVNGLTQRERAALDEGAGHGADSLLTKLGNAIEALDFGDMGGGAGGFHNYEVGTETVRIDSPTIAGQSAEASRMSSGMSPTGSR